MPFVAVPKDLTRVKSKVIFNLTKRQLICFGGGALVGVPAYIFTRGSIGSEAAAILMIGLMLPFFLFGIFEKDGQPMEKFLLHVIRVQFLCPGTRPYQTENLYAVLERQKNEEASTKLEKQTAKKAGKKAAKRKGAAQDGKGRSARH